MRTKLTALFTSATISGLIILFTGIYLKIFKAGVPPQNQTLEMAIDWRSYLYAGEYNIKIGIIVIFVGILGTLISQCMKQTNKSKEKENNN